MWNDCRQAFVGLWRMGMRSRCRQVQAATAACRARRPTLAPREGRCARPTANSVACTRSVPDPVARCSGVNRGHRRSINKCSDPAALHRVYPVTPSPRRVRLKAPKSPAPLPRYLRGVFDVQELRLGRVRSDLGPSTLGDEHARIGMMRARLCRMQVSRVRECRERDGQPGARTRGVPARVAAASAARSPTTALYGVFCRTSASPRCGAAALRRGWNAQR